MKEESDPNKKNQKPESYEHKQIRDAKESIKLKEKIEAEIRSNEEMQKLFQVYDPNSVERFIKEYIHKKFMWHKFSDLYLSKNEEEDLQWIYESEYHLNVIQQKKMFNAQCLWRAEEIEIKEVDITFDFVLWDDHALYCPFIEPISQEEVDMYINYLKSDNVELDRGWFEDWQDYEMMKMSSDPENGQSNYPEWYDYYDVHKGTGSLLLLPDHKGRKESFYFSLVSEVRKKERENKPVVKQNRKPMIKSVYDEKFLEWFVTKYEDSKTIKYYKAEKRSHRHSDDEEEIMDQIDMLLKSGENMPFEPAIDWRTSLELTVERYKLKKIAEYLPLAYEEYKMKLPMNMITDVDFIRKSKESIRQSIIKTILQGRDLNGEPQDLNF